MTNFLYTFDGWPLRCLTEQSSGKEKINIFKKFISRKVHRQGYGIQETLGDLQDFF